MSFRILVLAAIAAASFAGPRVASADPPCLDDIQKLCANVPATGGKIQACLKSHEKDLTGDCKKHVDGLRKTVQKLAAICVWDIERFCGDVNPGGGRIVTCLENNRNDLSPNCKASLGKAKD